jgi:hypothetical protein
MARTKTENAPRRSLTLPGEVAGYIKRAAKERHMSENSVTVQLIVRGIDAEKNRKEALLALIERFRETPKDSAEYQRLGDELGRAIFP